MLRIVTYRLVAVLAVVVLALLSCGGADKDWEHVRIISDKVTVYERPSATSKVLQELSFGADVESSDKNVNNEISKGWLQVRIDKTRGYIEKRGIASEEVYNELKGLSEGAKDAPVQATGVTGKKTPLLLRPENNAFVIQLIKEPVKADVLERLVVSSGDNEKARKSVWYKVRLENGRAGFIPKRSLRLTPPVELNAYTAVRTPVTWYVLGEKIDPATKNAGNDYLVTYESTDMDVDTDFARVEVYVYDPATKQYATALAKGGLSGFLPVTITDADAGGKVIEFRERLKGNKAKAHVMQYSYPKPIKLIKEYNEDVDVKQ